MANSVHAYTRTCATVQLNRRANGRRAPRNQERDKQRPRATQNHNCTTCTAGPTRHQGHRRTRRDRGGKGGSRGIQETPGGPEGKHGGGAEEPNKPTALFWFQNAHRVPAPGIIRAAGFIWTPNWLLGTKARPGEEERAGR
jgi:hypothetical protein